MDERKLTGIEETLAHQEQRISDLSEMVTRQWEEIDRLKARMGHLLDKVDYLEQNTGKSETAGLSVTEVAARNKPPHY